MCNCQRTAVELDRQLTALGFESDAIAALLVLIVERMRAVEDGDVTWLSDDPPVSVTVTFDRGHVDSARVVGHVPLGFRPGRQPNSAPEPQPGFGAVGVLWRPGHMWHPGHMWRPSYMWRPRHTTGRTVNTVNACGIAPH